MSRIVTELKCPRCDSEEFLAGPRGGAARNIKCAKCGYWMNVAQLPRYIPNTETVVAGPFWIVDEQGLDDIERPEKGNGYQR